MLLVCVFLLHSLRVPCTQSPFFHTLRSPSIYLLRTRSLPSLMEIHSSCRVRGNSSWEHKTVFYPLVCSNFPSCPSKLLYSCFKKKKKIQSQESNSLLIDTAPLNLYFLAVCAILLHQPRLNLPPLQQKCSVVTTGPVEKSLCESLLV